MASRRRSSQETVLITGASSGIGAALARRFAQGGYGLVLVARNAAALAALADELRSAHRVRVTIEPLDLRSPGAAATLAARLRRRRLPVGILVNNAGTIELGPFARMPATRGQQLIALNVAAATALLSAFLPAMIRRRRGRILNVCSVASFLPVPAMATYAASKAYLLSLSESLAAELDGSGVTVTALCPGVTATPMKAAAERSHPRVKHLPGFAVAAADAVAAEGFEACLRGEAICVPGLVNQVATLSGRVLPNWLVRRIVSLVGRQTL